jgi:hypothetical protein
MYQHKWGVLLIGLALLAACSFLQAPSKDEDGRFPVYVDPDSVFQIYNPEVVIDFPFETGDQVEIEGILIYHGIKEWIKTEMQNQAEWHASLYPHGRVITLDNESLIVSLKDISGEKQPFEFEWPMDHDTRIVIVSDKPLPKELFAPPEIGNTTIVCFSLDVEVSKSIDHSDQNMITLKPVGEIAGNLLLTEIRKCKRENL